jgi:hypothetical protein
MLKKMELIEGKKSNRTNHTASDVDKFHGSDDSRCQFNKTISAEIYR